MRLPLVVAAMAAIILTADRAVGADEPQRKLRSVVVKLDNTAMEIKGRLVSLDADTVTLLVKDHKVTFPKDRVVRIRSGRDSIRNGAVIGALIPGVLCALNCGQGLNNPGELPLAVAFAAGTWGAVGAGIDALINDDEILYERPTGATGLP